MNVIVIGDSFAFGHGCKDRTYFYDPDLKEYIGTPDFMYKGPSEYCWANLLQQEFKDKIKVINKAFPGRSMQGMYWDLLKAFRKYEVRDGDIVIFTGTVVNRIEIPTIHDAYDTASWGLNWHTMLPINERFKNVKLAHMNLEEREQAQSLYIKYLWNETIADQQAFSAIMSAWALCQHRNIQFFWSLPRVGFYDKKLIGTLRAYAGKSEIKGLLDYVFGTTPEINKKYRVIDGHANDEGHKFFYDVEIRQMFLKLFEEIKQ